MKFGLIGCICLVFCGFAWAGERDFSAPSTEAERALDTLLAWYMQQTDTEDGSLFDFLLQREDRETHNDALYATKITPTLVQAIAAAERKMEQENCPDGANDDVICGFDFDPILCAQDILLPPHFYHTLKAPADTTAGESVLIRYRNGADKDGHQADYWVQKEASGWKFAGVRCGTLKLNMP